VRSDTESSIREIVEDVIAAEATNTAEIKANAAAMYFRCACSLPSAYMARARRASMRVRTERHLEPEDRARLRLRPDAEAAPMGLDQATHGGEPQTEAWAPRV